jgi:hypothetical protein
LAKPFTRDELVATVANALRALSDRSQLAPPSPNG